MKELFEELKACHIKTTKAISAIEKLEIKEAVLLANNELLEVVSKIIKHYEEVKS